MGRLEKLWQLKAAVSESDAAQALRATEAARIAGEVAKAGAKEAKLTNRDGEVTKLSAARAAVRPAPTGVKLLKGAAKEALRQARDARAERDRTSDPDEAAPPRPLL